MFLSIIIPVYNSEKYLDECLQSCFNQDISTDDFEVICINDGSADNSLTILNEYKKVHTNMVVLDQANVGVSQSRNRAISIARGDYVWFVDSDDFIQKNCLQDLKNFSKKNYDIINFGAYSFKKSFTEDEKQLFMEGKLEPNETYWGCDWLHLYKTSIIKEHNVLFIEDLKYGEDEMFYNDIYEYAKNIINVNTVYYFYRLHPESAISSINNKAKHMEYFESVFLSAKILKTGLENHTYTKEFTEKFLKRRYKVLTHCLARLNYKDGKKCFYSIKRSGLFDYTKLPQSAFYSENEFKKAYINLFRKRTLRMYYKKTKSQIKRILPAHFVLLLKKIFKIKD